MLAAATGPGRIVLGADDPWTDAVLPAAPPTEPGRIDLGPDDPLADSALQSTPKETSDEGAGGRTEAAPEEEAAHDAPEPT